MKERLVFLLLAGFWVVMNILLWQSEQGGRGPGGAAISPALVWQKVLTASDPSTLEIFQRGKKIGLARWVAAIGEKRAGAGQRYEDSPEGMVRQVAGYSLDFDGNLALAGLGSNLRFYFHLALDEQQQWRELDLRLGLRPSSWEIHAQAASETITFRWQEGTAEWQHAWRFADLRDPRKLLEQFEGTGLLGPALGGLLPPGTNFGSNTATVTLGLNWEARHDLLRIAHTEVRVYRLEMPLWGRERIVILVSRAGEILRVNLPGDVALINFALTGY